MPIVFTNKVRHFCTGWKSVCTKFSDVCEATEEVCVKPVSICTNGIPRLCKNIPEWMRRCLWENQHEHDIGRQLEDGIRAFDIDTCVTNDGTVVTCHGKGPSRALGAPLDEHLMEIRDFLEQNPRELVTLEYNDYDGDIVLDGMAISEAINKYLPDKLYSHGGPDDPWPTLGELLKQGKQVVMFFGNQLHSLPHDKQPLWGNDRYAYYESTWNYTNTAHDDDAVIRLMYSYAATCSLLRVIMMTLTIKHKVTYVNARPTLQSMLDNNTNPGKSTVRLAELINKYHGVAMPSATPLVIPKAKLS
ncbi:PLC-like phosphodiesterase [Syncephalis plumigaleata]|nr:PLC-like phosphodiesterase [Syncephalis plumigaleata]